MNILKELSDSSLLIEKKLKEYLLTTDDNREELIKAESYSVLSGGKRIRPFLTLEFCKLFGGDAQAAMPYACAVELVHNYSLIHDDLPCMDNDDTRRGMPTCHKVFGEANALLAGDALLTQAFELCALNQYQSAENNLNAVAVLAKAAGNEGMIGGQALDIFSDTHSIDFDELLKLQKLKTGALIGASVALGCIAANLSKKEKRYSDATVYANNIGQAFQIIDDIIDAGELKSKDTKPSFITYMNEQAAYEYAARLTNEAICAIRSYQNNEKLVLLAEYLLKRKI